MEKTKLFRKNRELLSVFNNEIPKSVSSLLSFHSELNDDLCSPQYQTLGIVYMAFVAEVSDAQRKIVFRTVLEKVEEAEFDTGLVLAFIRYEPNHQLVCAAVWTYLQHRRASLEDPFRAVSEIVSILTRQDVVNRGAAYAALIFFGDRRVCSIARSIRDSITPTEARALVTTVTSPLHRATIEFCLEWLVKLVGRNQFDVAIPVSFAISAMIVRDSTLLVCDKEYNFGPYGFSSFTDFPDIDLKDFRVELNPILKVLSEWNEPALNHMIEVIANPTATSLEELEQRRDTPRRQNANRRASDRRIVDIAPRINRRASQRRRDERRQEIRR